MSLLVTGSPQFETQDDFGRGDGICALQQWQSQFLIKDKDLNLLDFDALGFDPDVGNIVNRLRSLFDDSTSHGPVILSATDLHDLTCFALHRLLSLPPFTDAQSSNTSECLRHAVAAYMFIVHGATYYSHVHILNALITQLQFHLESLLSSGECQDSLLLWYVSVGTVASTGTNESHWFRRKAIALSVALGLQCWDDVETHLKRVLWFEARSQVLFQRVWEGILMSNLSLHNLATPENGERPRNFSNTAAWHTPESSPI